jgi:hypothetical protein
VDDPTKSCANAQLKQRYTRVVNCDFKSLTKNVPDQKDSTLCAPICVSALLRWAIKNDLKLDANTMDSLFTIEKILTKLTMIIYPRSLAGMNLNPRKKEKNFQHTEMELLLERLKYKTYLHLSGWHIIRGSIQYLDEEFDFNKGKIFNYFQTIKTILKSCSTPRSSQPVTVTG